MDQTNVYLILGKLLFLINIIISYPLIVFAIFQILESLLFQKMKYSMCRTWLKNLSRTVVVLTGLLIAFFFYYNLHKILGLAGVVLGSFIVLITPSLIHRKLNADTAFKKGIDIAIIIYAVIMAVWLSTLIIYRWDKV